MTNLEAAFLGLLHQNEANCSRIWPKFEVTNWFLVYKIAHEIKKTKVNIYTTWDHI